MANEELSIYTKLFELKRGVLVTLWDVVVDGELA
jgi:hypothetical protein